MQEFAFTRSPEESGINRFNLVFVLTAETKIPTVDYDPENACF